MNFNNSASNMGNNLALDEVNLPKYQKKLVVERCYQLPFYTDKFCEYRFSVDKWNDCPTMNISKYTPDVKTGKWVNTSGVYFNLNKWTKMLENLKEADDKFREIVYQGMIITHSAALYKVYNLYYFSRWK